MGIFSYEVVDRRGIASVGRLEADSEAATSKKLQQLGYIVTDVKEVKSSRASNLLKMERKVSLGDLSMFSRQMAAMLDAGIPLTQSLFTLSRQIKNVTLKKTVGIIAGNVESGMSFAEALSAYPKVFSKLYTGMVRAGEAGGTLEESLLRLSEQLQKEKALRTNIRSATLYPMMVAGFAVVILFIMMFFVVPIFVKMFPAGVTLPLPTRIIVAFSESLRSWWYLWFLGCGVIMATIRTYFNGTAGKRLWDMVKLRLPIFGSLIQKTLVARFSRTLSTLLSGGMPVLQALEAAGQASGNVIMQEVLEEAKEKIQEGKSIAEPLKDSSIFPPMVIQMVSVGEETGSLSYLLTKIADFYEEEVDTLTKGLTALIEPLMLVFVGLTVGGMVMALYLPIFSAVTQVGR